MGLMERVVAAPISWGPIDDLRLSLDHLGAVGVTGTADVTCPRTFSEAVVKVRAGLGRACVRVA
jgi:hypothetical protein